MSMMQIAGFALAAAFAAAAVRRLKPDMGMALALAAGVMVLGAVATRAGDVVSAISALCGRAELQTTYVQTMLKVVGVCLLSDFAASVCRDAEEEGLAARVELAGRVIVLTLAVPVLATLLEKILSLVP